VSIAETNQEKEEKMLAQSERSRTDEPETQTPRPAKGNARISGERTTENSTASGLAIYRKQHHAEGPPKPTVSESQLKRQPKCKILAAQSHARNRFGAEAPQLTFQFQCRAQDDQRLARAQEEARSEGEY